MDKEISNYEKHAYREFRAAGWVDENGKFDDDMQEAICSHVLRLLQVFAEEGHSGSSAPYAISLFSKLASFEPIAPLTGEDWEWNRVSKDLLQNNRCSHVFKNSDGYAYDIEGRIFYTWYTDEETGEKYKSHFTKYESRVPVTFPYVPNKEYVEVLESPGE